MSQENVTRLQTAVEAFNNRDGESSIACSRRTPKSCLSEPHSNAPPIEARTQASQYVAAVGESWDSLRWEVDELHEVGESVLALGRIRGRGRGTGATIDTSGGWAAEFRDGRITRFRTCTSRKAALEAAGLSGATHPMSGRTSRR